VLGVVDEGDPPGLPVDPRPVGHADIGGGARAFGVVPRVEGSG
jgi:hypothetical protein